MITTAEKNILRRLAGEVAVIAQSTELTQKFMPVKIEKEKEKDLKE